MKLPQVIALASVLCAVSAAVALPSEAAPFFGNNIGGNYGNNCGPGFNTGFNGGNRGFGNGFGFNNGYRNGFGSINGKEAVIGRQIQNGIRNGSLTPREANNLMRDQARLQGLQNRLASNGLSWNDRARLNNDLKRLENNVRRQSTDGQRRYW